MEALIEFRTLAGGFIILCVLLVFGYLLVRKMKFWKNFYLVVVTIFLFHVLIYYLVAFVPGAPLPNFIVKYVSWIISL